MIKLRATFSAEAFEATAYVALSAVLGVIAFCVLLPTLLVGTALLVVALAGLPLIVLAFAFSHLLARLERRRVKAVFGIDFPTRHLPRDGNWLSRALRWLGSRGAWLELTLRARRAAVRRLDRLRPGLLRLGRRARDAQLPALGPVRRRRRT